MFYDPNEFDDIFYLYQLLVLVVSQGFFLHFPLVFEFRPMIEELKMIHHLQNLSNDFVMDPTNGTDLFIQKTVPIHLPTCYNPHHGLVEVEELGQLLRIKIAFLGCCGFSHAHEAAIAQEIEALRWLVGSSQVGDRLQGLLIHFACEYPTHGRMPHNNEKYLLQLSVTEPKKRKGFQIFQYLGFDPLNHIWVEIGLHSLQPIYLRHQFQDITERCVSPLLVFQRLSKALHKDLW